MEAERESLPLRLENLAEHAHSLNLPVPSLVVTVTVTLLSAGVCAVTHTCTIPSSSPTLISAGTDTVTTVDAKII
jgi:hypothetical protein